VICCFETKVSFGNIGKISDCTSCHCSSVISMDGYFICSICSEIIESVQRLPFFVPRNLNSIKCLSEWSSKHPGLSFFFFLLFLFFSLMMIFLDRIAPPFDPPPKLSPKETPFVVKRKPEKVPESEKNSLLVEQQNPFNNENSQNNQPRTQEIFCSRCISDSPAIMHCSNCSQFLCDFHVEDHRRTRLLSQHTLTQIPQVSFLLLLSSHCFEISFHFSLYPHHSSPFVIYVPEQNKPKYFVNNAENSFAYSMRSHI